MIKTLVNNFVTERNSSDVMAIGLNACREICVRCPLAMNEDLLRDLTMYKNYKEKSVMMAAKSLILLYREQMPTLLAKKDRGRPTEASVEIKPKKYGEVQAVDHIPGTEALLNAAPALDVDGEEDDDASDSDGNWVDVDSDDEVIEEKKKGITMIKKSKPEEEDEEAEEASDEEDEDDDGEWETDSEACSEDIEEDGEEEAEPEEEQQKEKPKSSLKNANKKQPKNRSKSTSNSAEQEASVGTTLSSKEAIQELALTKIFTDADFQRIEQEQIKKKMTHNTRKRQLEKEKSEFVKLDDIELIYKKRKTDREARIESMKKGREGREKFGYKDNRHDPFCSKTNTEKRKNKNFNMIRHKARGKVKKSFREKQLALRKHLTHMKKMK